MNEFDDAHRFDSLGFPISGTITDCLECGKVLNDGEIARKYEVCSSCDEALNGGQA